MLDHFWAQPGFVIGDFTLAVIATICAFWSYVEIASHVSDGLKTRKLWGALFARWMVALGWTIISWRIWYALATLGDAPIAAVSVVALSMIGSGWIALQLVRPS